MYPRPRVTDPSVAIVGATAVVLAAIIAALGVTQPRFGTAIMVAATLVAGAVLIRTLGATIGVLVLLIVACFVDQWVFRAGGFNIRPEQIALILGLAVYAVERVRTRRSLLLKPNVFEAVLLAWFALGLVSSLIQAPDRVESLKILALLMLSSLATFLPRRLLDTRREDFDEVVGWLLLAFALESAYSVGTYFLHLFGPTIAMGLNPASGRLESLGTLWEPNVLGAMCAAGGVAWIFLGPRYFTHPWIGVALCFTATVTSFARGAWLGGLVVLLLIIVLPVRRRLDLRALGAGALATILLIVGVIASDIGGAYSSKNGISETVSNSVDIIGRIYQIRSVLSEMGNFSHMLIGGGVDSYGQIHVVNGRPDHLASLELVILNDTGVIGAALFALFVVLIAIAAWRRAHDITVLGLAAMMFLLVITNAATSTIELMITWLLLGMLIAAIDLAKEPAVTLSADTARDTAA